MKRVEWFEHNYKTFLENKTQIRVLDVGGRDINGNYKQLFKAENYIYEVLDIADGDGVDIIPREPYSWKEIEDDTYDIVISGQTFQHIEYPWLTIKEIGRVLKKGGICCILAPSNRYNERYPIVCYGILKDGFVALAKWAGLKVLHVSVAGVPCLETDLDWDYPLDDGMLIAQKPREDGTVIEHAPQLTVERRYKDPYKMYLQLKGRLVTELKNKNDSRVILYGMNELGRDIFYRLKDEIEIPFVIDKDENLHIVGEAPCFRFHEAEFKSKDYLLITLLNYEEANRVKKMIGKDVKAEILIEKLNEMAK